MKIEVTEWKLGDAKDLVATINNKAVLDNLRDGLPYPYTEKDAEDYILSMLSSDKSKIFAFAVRVDGVAVGSIGIFRQDNIHFRTAELGYYLKQELWGRGIMPEAVKSACDFVFSRSDIVRIYAEPFADNVASCRVLEKCGFSCEGVMRKNAFKNGEFKDMKLYSLVR